MTKDMNTGRLLYIICLLTISVVGGNLKAQTIVKHQIGFDTVSYTHLTLPTTSRV